MKIKTTEVVETVSEEEVQISELEKKTVLEFFESKSFYCNSYDCEKLAEKVDDYYCGENPVMGVFREIVELEKAKNVPVLEKLDNAIDDLYERCDYDDEKGYEEFCEELGDTWREYLKEVLTIRKVSATVSKVVEHEDDSYDILDFLNQYDILDSDVRITIDTKTKTATIKKI